MPRAKGLKKSETPDNLKAFEMFVKLGGILSKKNREEIAAPFGFSPSSVWNWYLKFDWRKRFQDRTKSVSMTKADWKAIVVEAASQFNQKLKAGKIILKHPSDLEKIAKVNAMIEGERTGEEITINIQSSAPRPGIVVKEVPVDILEGGNGGVIDKKTGKAIIRQLKWISEKAKKEKAGVPKTE